MCLFSRHSLAWRQGSAGLGQAPEPIWTGCGRVFFENCMENSLLWESGNEKDTTFPKPIAASKPQITGLVWSHARFPLRGPELSLSFLRFGTLWTAIMDRQSDERARLISVHCLQLQIETPMVRFIFTTSKCAGCGVILLSDFDWFLAYERGQLHFSWSFPSQAVLFSFLAFIHSCFSDGPPNPFARRIRPPIDVKRPWSPQCTVFATWPGAAWQRRRSPTWLRAFHVDDTGYQK